MRIRGDAAYIPKKQKRRQSYDKTQDEEEHFDVGLLQYAGLAADKRIARAIKESLRCCFRPSVIPHFCHAFNY